MKAEKHFTLAELAEFLCADVQGDSTIVIHRLATLQEAGRGALTFLSNPAYEKFLSGTEASAVLLSPEMAEKYEGNALVMKDPYLGYARVSRLFEPEPVEYVVHPTAWVDETAVVSPEASIGPQVTIEAGASVAAGARIGAGSVIGRNSIIGKDTVLNPNVTICHGVVVGDRCILHSGAVLGSDGFGFAHDGQSWVKIAQLGGVVVGDDVEIGANSAIDRGALADTMIGHGVIIDNHVHIAHNVVIGDKTAIAGCTGISGSTKIGRNCIIAGGCGIAGHLEVTDGVHLAGMAMVTKSILKPGQYSSGSVGCMPVREWRKNTVRFRQLDDMARRLKELEKKLD
ncbi:UDP-3-O-(3-hydroxymyristoyl)glucosamine N-acyltransferase [Kistimonas asteriae]|uniref:UDP-3-O-(3-hydroxymyristoyl)glucosamine N-acyltransferase n=1 Tax=Kistimonas asteriae TaxID=517724 RepID=UPI001BA86A9A|nr:UDP-3-O-(3-hydroxymyristoyl)glucosamine N-acyltransferase [Kistimonas asteriae]